MGLCFSSDSPSSPSREEQQEHHHHHKHREDPSRPIKMQQEGERQSGKTVPQASTTKSMSHPADHAAGEGVNSRQLPPNAISPRRSLSRRGSSGPVALSAKDSLVLSADDESDATGHRKSSSTEANGTHVDDPEAESKAWAEYEARRERLERRRREREAREEQRRKNIEALNAASNYTYMDGTTQRHGPQFADDFTPRGTFTPRGINRESSALSLYADRLTSTRRYQASPRTSSVYGYQPSPRAAGAQSPATGRYAPLYQPSPRAAGGQSPATGRYTPIYQPPALVASQSAYTTSGMAPPQMSRERSAFNTPLPVQAAGAGSTPGLRRSSADPPSARKVSAIPPTGGDEALLDTTTTTAAPSLSDAAEGVAVSAAVAPSLPMESLSRQTSTQVPSNVALAQPVERPPARRDRDHEEEVVSVSSGDTSLFSSFIGQDSVTKTPIADRSPIEKSPTPKSPYRELPPQTPTPRGVSTPHNSTPRAELGSGLAAAVNKKDWNGINNLFYQRS